MLNFKDFVTEEYAPDTRTESMINEAQENIRSIINKHFISATKVTKKELEKLINRTDKSLVTTDGKWNVSYRRSDSEVFVFSDSSMFMKNGKTVQYVIGSRARTNNLIVFNTVARLIDEAKGDIHKMVTLLKNELKDSKDPEVYEKIYISVYEENNKDGAKMNPYNMIDNVKAYTKEIRMDSKLRSDDIVKMVVNGQIDKIVVDHHLSDDYAFDGAGRTMDPIEFLKDDVLNFNKPYIAVRKDKEGKIYIGYSIHSNYSVALSLNKSKVKVAS